MMDRVRAEADKSRLVVWAAIGVVMILTAAAVFGLAAGGSRAFTWGTAETLPPARFTYEKVVVDPVAEPEPWMKSIGDLNGDGAADLIVSGRNGRVVWYETPNWTKRVIAESVTSQSGSAASDIDGDGDVDVIVGVTWYENADHGSSWVAHQLFAGNFNMTHDTVIADLNNDRKPDIAMRGETHSTVYVYLQTDRANWTLFTVDPGIGLNGLDAADLNGDGRRDLVVGGRWMENPGGDLATAAWPVHTFASWLGYAAVKVSDLDGGGLPDIVLSPSEETGNLSWFEQLSDGSWAEHVIDTGLDSVHGFLVADIDHDGLLDIVSSEYRGQGRLTIYRQERDAAGGISWQANNMGTDKLHNIQAADLNADCKLDFFGAFSLSETTPVVLYRSTGAKAC